MEVRSHKDLIVWQRAMELVTDSYALTERIPNKEVYGLTSQLQRAAVSVPANIAEGHARKTTGAFLNHLSIANGSLAELETHLELGIRLKYVSPADVSSVFSTLEEV